MTHIKAKLLPIHYVINFLPMSLETARGGAAAARWAHNPKVAGSSPAPATKKLFLVNRLLTIG